MLWDNTIIIIRIRRAAGDGVYQANIIRVRRSNPLVENAPSLCLIPTRKLCDFVRRIASRLKFLCVCHTLMFTQYVICGQATKLHRA